MKHIIKDKSQDKVSRVMREFKEGTLKDRGGNTVTDKNQAIAIALSEAGLSKKSLENAAMLNKVRVMKQQIYNLIRKEEKNTKNIIAEIINFFKINEQIDDSQIHELAQRLGLNPNELENYIYSIISSFVRGGKSKGKEMPVDQKELEMGIAVESEHTDNKQIAEKIARDHLVEDEKYYTKLKQVEQGRPGNLDIDTALKTK